MPRATGARVEAADLGLETKGRAVYSGVGVNAGPGSMTWWRSGPGSGRTALLLTIGGRMRPTAGTLRVDGHPLPRAARKVRRIAAPALCDGVNDLDDRLTVGEHLSERLLLRPRPAPRAAAVPALDAAGLTGIDPARRAGGLDLLQRRRLGVALALLEEPRLLLVDDADGGLPPGQSTAFAATLSAIADAGTTVIATATDTATPEDT